MTGGIVNYIPRGVSVFESFMKAQNLSKKKKKKSPGRKGASPILSIYGRSG